MQSTVNVDASLSSDTDGTIQRYEWVSSDAQLKSGKTASFTFEKAGDYTITLTVTDDKGATSQSVKSIPIGSGSCTSAIINNCRASYSFDGTLCVPCVGVPGVFGTAQVFALEMNQKPFSLNFEVNPLTLKQHSYSDACAASYAPLTGALNLPCVSVGAGNYNVDMQQRAGGLIFEVTGVR